MAENTNNGGSSGSGKAANIRTRENSKEVKGINRAANLADRTREAFVRTKQKTESLMDESSDNEVIYAEDRVTDTSKEAARDAGNEAKEGARKIKNRTRKQIEKRLEKRLEKMENRQAGDVTRGTGKGANTSIRTAEQGTRTIKTSARSSGEATVRTSQKTVKTAEQTIKGTTRTVKTTVKTTEKAAQAAKKTAEVSAKASEKAATAAKQGTEAAIRASIMAAKAIAAAFKSAFGGIGKVIIAIAGSFTAIVPVIIFGCVIIAVCILCTGDTHRDGSSISTDTVIEQINEQWEEQLEDISGTVEDVTVEGSRATWTQVFSLYTAYSSKTSVNDWDERRDISMIFWHMNSMSYENDIVVEARTAAELPVTIKMKSTDVTFAPFSDGTVTRTEEETYRNTKTIEEVTADYPNRTWHQKIMITVSHLSEEEMYEWLSLDDNQIEEAEGLMEEEFESFWRERIYGVNGADDDIVNVAVTQLGNSGGWPYWEYSGFDSRVEWCACFVSWCAGQCGYVDSGQMINTGSPPAQVAFFKSEDHWRDGSATPVSGMIIFFDWYDADFADHVGIVEKVEDGVIYTIEGNADDSVKRNSWVVGDSQILGFGWIVD